MFVDKSDTCGGATVGSSICGEFRLSFALISTGRKASAILYVFAVAFSRGGMVGEGIGSLCLLSLVWF